MPQLPFPEVLTIMPGIFISYRREDSAAYARLLYDGLANHFGKDNVFMDIDSIEPGLDFVEVLERTMSMCDAVVVVIGKQWLAVTDSDGRRRLDNPEDLVRSEVAAALERKEIRVVPALVGGARMPSRNELPQAIALLARRNALEINDLSFQQTVARLIEALDKNIRKAQSLAIPVPDQQKLQPPDPVPEEARAPTFPIYPSAYHFETSIAKFLTWLLLLYKPQGNADWVSWAWVCRIIFGLSFLFFALLRVLLLRVNQAPEPALVALVIVVGSHVAARWCDIRAFKEGLASSARTSNWNAGETYLSVPAWRRTLLLYVPRGASGWVFMGWVSRILVLLSGALSSFFVYIGIVSRPDRADPEFWGLLSAFVAAAVLFRFVASWFDNLAARGQTKPVLSRRQDAQG